MSWRSTSSRRIAAGPLHRRRHVVEPERGVHDHRHDAEHRPHDDQRDAPDAERDDQQRIEHEGGDRIIGRQQRLDQPAQPRHRMQSGAEQEAEHMATTAAATMLNSVNTMSLLNRPLSRMSHSDAAISVGGIIVTRLMIPRRHSNSSAEKTMTINAVRRRRPWSLCHWRFDQSGFCRSFGRNCWSITAFQSTGPFDHRSAAGRRTSCPALPCRSRRATIRPCSRNISGNRSRRPWLLLPHLCIDAIASS